MSRPLRIEYSNAFYHAMNRGASRREIFLVGDDYKIFLETLKETSKIFGIRIISYCLMPNHYHLLIQTPNANLSRAMRHLNGVYTQRFNRIHKKDGALFRGRYKAILIQEDEYLTHLIRYIHLNPIQANLTSSPEGFTRTSHEQYLKAKDETPWLFVRLGLAFFSNKRNQALKAYRRFIQEGIDPRTSAFYDKKHLEPILGNPAFLRQIKEKYIDGREKLDSEIPEERKISGANSTDRIIREVSKAFSKSRQAVFQSKRGEENQARLMALLLTRELSGLRLFEIAQVFGVKSYRTVASNCFRFKRRMAQDPQTKRRYTKIYEICTNICSQEKT